MRRNFTKLLSLIMTLCMLVGIMPMWLFVSAAETTESVLLDTAVFASDVHGISADLQNVMSAIGADDIEPSSVNLLGDTMLKMTVAENAIETGLGVDTDVNYVYASKHDDPDTDSDAGDCDIEDDWDFSGPAPNDADYNYHIYIIRESDIAEGSSTYSSAISAFTTWANNITDDKPIFVITHRPLHVRRGENDFAGKWFDAINPVGEDKDVFVLWGHNHYGETSDDRNAYYVAKGDSLNVQYEGNQYSNGVTKNDINFTYMNAGYINANDYTYGNQSVGRRYMATVAFIYNDKIVFQDYFYNKNNTGYLLSGYYYDTTVTSGKYLDYGVKNLSNASYAHNETVELMNKTEIGEPEVPEVDTPTVPATPLTDPATGVVVNASGITALSVKKVEKQLDEKYNAAISYDITLEGYTQGTTAAVTIPAPDTFDDAKPVYVLYEDEVIAITNIASGKVSFMTDHFSVYTIAQSDEEITLDEENWVTITSPTNKTIYRLTDSLTANKKYVIVSRNTADSGNAVNLNSGSINSTKVTVESDANGAYIEVPSTTAQWTYTADKYFQNASSTASYLRGRSSTGSLRVGTTTSSYITWNYNTTYGLYGSNSNYNMSSSFSMASRSNTNRVYIYVEETQPATPGLYAQAVGGDSVLSAPAGSLETGVIATAKQYVDVYTTADKNGTSVDVIDDEKVAWNAKQDTTDTSKWTVTVSYNGKTLKTVEVSVMAKAIKDAKLSSTTGTSERGTALTDTKIIVTYDDNTTAEIPVIANMITAGTFDINKNGTYTGLTVSYAGYSFENYTMKVVNITGVDDFPAYPNPGSVNLNKTATGLDFQNTGLAQVQLSTSGLPVAKGVDVIVMLDLSSSMDRCTTCGKYVSKYSSKNKECTCNNPSTRVDELQASLLEFEKILDQAENKDDIRVAVAGFNGFFANGTGPVGRDTNDEIGDYLSSDNQGQIFTGPSAAKEGLAENLGADTFISVSELNVAGFANMYYNCIKTGTNYDHGMDMVYQLGTAIKAENKKNGVEDRELVVLFMSDGASNQFNFYSTQGNNNATNWNQWLNGSLKTEAEVKSIITNASSEKHYYYYDLVDHDGDGIRNEHRMANAIKGDPSKKYEVIRQSTEGLPEGTMTAVAAPNGTNPSNLWNVPGLGAKMYSIAFYIKDDSVIKTENIKISLEQIATDSETYIDATSGSELTSAFQTIARDILFAATNSRFVDQLGSAFELQMNPVQWSNDSKTDVVNNSTDITVTTHPVYTERDAIAGKCTQDDIGKPYGDGELKEKVSFVFDDNNTPNDPSDDKLTAVTSTARPDVANILVDGVIRGKYFFYNTTNTVKKVDLANGSTYDLPAETFYWNIGLINETQFTLTYTVYLSGSLEDGAPAGSYQTNNFAILYYDNYVGNEVSQSVASPTMAWSGAKVSYAFYLVNSNGQPVYKDGSLAPNFYTAYKVTQPVVYRTVELNNTVAVIAGPIAKDVLPEGYTLYAQNVKYDVSVASGSGDGANHSSWTITDGENATYVTGYGKATDYTNKTNVTTDSTSANYVKGYDFTNTTVWFPVLWIPSTIPDTVVIDFGIPVDIHVLENDQFGTKGTLNGIASLDKINDLKAQNGQNVTLETLNKEHFENSVGVSETLNSTYGKVSLVNGKVRYIVNDMNMSSYDRFIYEVSYPNENNVLEYYYGTVTVIPATTIYYEESFVQFNNSSAATNDSDMGKWIIEGSVMNAVQGEDRPGFGNLPSVDANNIYGYDPAYDNFTQYSLGSAKKVTVDAATGISYRVETDTKKSTAPYASFTFTGTGFDVISLTNNLSGTIVVNVSKVNSDGTSTLVARKTVDTYYGYTYNETTKEFEVNPDANGSIWQVPVLKYEAADYGTYNVKIEVVYLSSYDHTGDGSYSFWLDAIRIYDPAQGDDTAEDAYVKDNEWNPQYMTLRNLLVSAGSLGTDSKANDTTNVGVVFIDGKASTGDINDYANPGPNNETYLAYGQGVAFKLTSTEKPAAVHLGVKLAYGTSATLLYRDTSSLTVATATDMYYDLGNKLTWTLVGDKYESNDIILSNATNGAVISITNIKYTFAKPDNDSDPGAAEASLMAVVDEEVLTSAPMMLMRMYAPVAEPDPFVPETFETSWIAGKAGKISVLTVTTSDDVASVTIDGNELAYVSLPIIKYENWKLSVTYVKVWMYTVKLGEGTHSYELVAYDADGLASEPVEASVTVVKNGRR